MATKKELIAALEAFEAAAQAEEAARAALDQARTAHEKAVKDHDRYAKKLARAASNGKGGTRLLYLKDRTYEVSFYDNGNAWVIRHEPEILG